MEKQKFQKVSLNTPTYGLLTDLAQQSGFTRSAYIRLLLQAQANQKNAGRKNAGQKNKSSDFPLPMPVAQFVTDAKAQAAMAGVELVFKNGEVLRFHDMKWFERWAHRYYQKRASKDKSQNVEALVDKTKNFHSQSTREPAT